MTRNLEILFEDNWLVAINKPAGMLSVPGKADIDSVYHRLKARYPEANIIYDSTPPGYGNLRHITGCQDKRSTSELTGTVQEPNGKSVMPRCLTEQSYPKKALSTFPLPRPYGSSPADCEYGTWQTSHHPI